jgi:hypothetical protein
MAAEEKEILLTWKDISAYLGCEIRTCQRWEKEAGLPVHRILDSSKSRVFAYKQELDEWIKEKTQSPNKNKWKYLYFLIPLAALFLIYFMFISPFPFSQPNDFKINGSELVVLDKNHKEIWGYDTGVRGLENEEFYRNHFQFRRYFKAANQINFPLLIIRDMDHNQKKEVMFAVRQIGSNQRGGRFLFFDQKGRIKWTFNPGREMTFGQKVYSSEYGIHGFDTEDIDNDGLHEIIMISFNICMFPSQLAVLDQKGQLLREYWNSGRIYDFSFFDLDKDGKKEIILGGCNNEYDKGFLAVLDHDFTSGGSPQTGYYKSPDLQQGVEEHYLLFPKTIVDENEYVRGNIVRIHLIDDKIISAETKSGIYFEFDFNMELKEIRFADRYEDLHNEAYKEGLSLKRFSPKLMAELKSELMPHVLYFTGGDWTNRPLMAKNPFPKKKK